MKLADILRAGKEHIKTLGWVQGDENVFQLHSMKRCAATAMAPVNWSYEETERACRFFEAANGIESGVIADWNDADGRTVEEVLAAYDKAIADADAKGA